MSEALEQPVASPWRFWLRVVLAVYWVGLFGLTHTPLPPDVLPEGGDKAAHLIAYAGLGVLLGLNVARRGPLAWRQGLAILGVLALYGALDELLQIPVNRTCDFHDWVFDLLGASLGLAAVAAGQRMFGRRQ